MFAVIRRYNAQPGTTHQILERVDEGFAPILRALDGFVAYTVLDAGDGTIASVSIFETRESAEASTQLASDWVRRNIPSLIRTSPVIVTGNVRTYLRCEGSPQTGQNSVGVLRTARRNAAMHDGSAMQDASAVQDIERSRGPADI